MLKKEVELDFNTKKSGLLNINDKAALHLPAASLRGLEWGRWATQEAVKARRPSLGHVGGCSSRMSS